MYVCMYVRIYAYVYVRNVFTYVRRKTYCFPPFSLDMFLFDGDVVSLHEGVPLISNHLKPATSQNLPLLLHYVCTYRSTFSHDLVHLLCIFGGEGSTLGHLESDGRSLSIPTLGQERWSGDLFIEVV